MKNMGMGTLAAKRAEINARHSEVKSWRKLAESDYPDVKPGTLCAVARGYVPKTKRLRVALGMVRQLKSYPNLFDWPVKALAKAIRNRY